MKMILETIWVIWLCPPASIPNNTIKTKGTKKAPIKLDIQVDIKAPETRPPDKSVYATDKAIVVGTIDKKKKPICRLGPIHHKSVEATSKGKPRKFQNRTNIGSCIGLQDWDKASFERPKPWKAKITAMRSHFFDALSSDTDSMDCPLPTANPITSTKPKINP